MFKKLFIPILFVLYSTYCYSQELKIGLDRLQEQYSFTYETLKTDTFFSEKYVLNFEQPVDHKNPRGPKFNQRVFISHRGLNHPVVFITEGYGASYAASPRYKNELTKILNTNQICVEHRYFGESVPKPLDWKQLTVYNAASDHHRILEALKQIYVGKWVNTGISKGGQTTMYHRYFYPDDVDASVGYVCPLNFSIEDKRVYRFLDQVGDSVCRANIFNYQLEMLQNKSIYLDEFKKLAEKKNLTYSMGILQAYELTVLEYSFAFWQWGVTDCNHIPLTPNQPHQMVKHLDDVAGINWIADEGIHRLQAFFYQALVEIGFYGYNITPFKEYISFQSNPTFNFTVPDNVSITYDPILMQKVDHFIRHKAENMMFIYGEYDPWSSTAVDLTYNTNSVKIINPGGSHRTRINNLPKEQRNLVIFTLKIWLEIKD